MSVDNEILGEMFNSSIRAERIIHIGSQLLDESFSDDVKEALSDDWDKIFEAIGISPPEDEDELAWHFRAENKQGFLMQFATPVPVDITGSSYTFSWGYYTLRWIYAESIQECCEKSIEWANDYIEEQREKKK